MGYSPWGRKELDTTERLSTHRNKIGEKEEEVLDVCGNPSKCQMPHPTDSFNIPNNLPKPYFTYEKTKVSIAFCPSKHGYQTISIT